MGIPIRNSWKFEIGSAAFVRGAVFARNAKGLIRSIVSRTSTWN